MNILETAIGIIGTLLGTLIGVFSTLAINNKNIEFQKASAKRPIIDALYKELTRILLLFPESSPNELLDGSFWFQMEDFDSVIHILDIQKEGLLKQKITLEKQSKIDNDLDIEISNNEYKKREILKINNSYSKAVQAMGIFNETQRANFELNASQEVKNMLVVFEVTIHNVFISGQTFSENVIDINRNRLIDSMRNDLNA